MHYAPLGDDAGGTVSISPVPSTDLTKSIPYTSTNNSIYKYELNRLLEQPGGIDSRGDEEARKGRERVVKVVERTLE